MKRLALLSALLLTLAGCSSTLPARLYLSATPAINPDPAGQAAPVEIWLYELKSPEAFERAGFFDLYLHPDDTLDHTVLGMTRFSLRPSEIRTIDRPISPQTRYLGVLVGYRDIDNSRWRQVIAVDPGQAPVVHIDVDARTVTVGEGKPPALRKRPGRDASQADGVVPPPVRHKH